MERGGQIRDIALVTLLLNTGLRLQELCALMVLGYAAHAGSNAPVLMGNGGA